MRIRFNLTISVIIILCVLTMHVCAQTDTQDTSFKSINGHSKEQAISSFNDLIKIIEETTEIASHTKLNADYVPGMVSVLYGDELESWGILTVAEALSTIPGMETQIEQIGGKQIIVRGIGQTFGSGNVKILLNGNPMNNTYMGTASSVLDLPIKNINRIEINRGPGTAIYGEYAYSGVVNIITRKEGNNVSFYLGDNQTFIQSCLFSHKLPDNDFSMSLNMIKIQSDGQDEYVEKDRVYSFGMGFETVSNAPGPPNEKMNGYATIANISYKDFSLFAQLLGIYTGDYYGLTYILPESNDNIVLKPGYMMLNAQQLFTINPSLKIDLSMGIWRNTWHINKGLVFPKVEGFEDGVLVTLNYGEQRIYGKFDIIWQGIDNHDILLSYAYSLIQMRDIWQETNYHPILFTPLNAMTRFSGDLNFIQENQERTIHSMIFQDNIHICDALTVTIGFRNDDYDDAGSNISPRFATAWCINDSNIFKYQYSQAFRPPTFMELYIKGCTLIEGNPEIQSEKLYTHEIGYIYRQKNTLARLTLFHTRLKDLIVLKHKKYQNIGEVEINGSEIEYNQTFGDIIKMNTNLSFFQTLDKETDEKLPQVANILGNVGIMIQPYPNWNVSFRYQYVGNRSREFLDTRKHLDGYHTTDITFSIHNIGFPGLVFKCGVKNLLNADVRYPSPLDADFLGNPIPSYPEDFPRPGINGWAQISFEF